VDEEKKGFINSVINTVGWWLVHIVAAIKAPEKAMEVASGMAHPMAGDDIEDLDPDEDDLDIDDVIR